MTGRLPDREGESTENRPGTGTGTGRQGRTIRILRPERLQAGGSAARRKVERDVRRSVRSTVVMAAVFTSVGVGGG